MRFFFLFFPLFLFHEFFLKTRKRRRCDFHQALWSFVLNSSSPPFHQTHIYPHPCTPHVNFYCLGPPLYPCLPFPVRLEDGMFFPRRFFHPPLSSPFRCFPIFHLYSTFGVTGLVLNTLKLRDDWQWLFFPFCFFPFGPGDPPPPSFF